MSFLQRFIPKLAPIRCFYILLGSGILSFGLYQVHSFADITEGGVLGMTLLLYQWFGLSPALSGLVLNLLCYGFGFKILGKDFLGYSVVAGLGFSLFYAVFERFPMFWSSLAQKPLWASVLGALFVGIGVGLAVKAGGAPSGDDALAMGLAKWTGVKLQWFYLCSDLLVLGLSVTYIPFSRLAYSLLTVVLSGQIIGLVQRLPLPGLISCASSQEETT